MLEYLIFAVTTVVALIGAIIWLYPGSRKVSTIPGMDPTDVKDGNMSDVARAGSLHEFLMQLHDTYGPISYFWWGEQMVVSIASAELFKQHSRVFDRPALLFKLFEPLITPHSIQYANGADGRRRRTLYDEAYSHQAITSYFAIFQDVADDLTKKLSGMASEEEHIPLMQYTFALAVKNIAIATFGEFSNDKDIVKLRTAYDVTWGIMENKLAGVFPDENGEKMFEKQKTVMNDIIKDCIARRKKNPSKQGRRLLIDLMIEDNMSESAIVADCMTYIIGGFHTTGLLLTWSIYFLSTHPEVQDEVFSEIQAVLGKKDITPDNMQDLLYLRQVLDETMRCSILAPYAARVQEHQSTLAGHVIEPKTPVIHALGVTMRDETVWPDPERFDPSRFDADKVKAREPYSFEPFGFAGKRKCPGYRLLYSEATVALVTLLRKLKFRLIDGQVVLPEYGLVTKPKDEIWVKVEKRS